MEPEDADAQVTGWSEWNHPTSCGSCDPEHPDWDGDTCCIEGRIYGPCEWEDEETYGTCSGFCVSEGECQCVCHAEPSKAG